MNIPSGESESIFRWRQKLPLGVSWWGKWLMLSKLDLWPIKQGSVEIWPRTLEIVRCALIWLISAQICFCLYQVAELRLYHEGYGCFLPYSECHKVSVAHVCLLALICLHFQDGKYFCLSLMSCFLGDQQGDEICCFHCCFLPTKTASAD